MILDIDTRNIEDYRRFLAVRKLPAYRFRGHWAEFDDAYASRLGMADDTETDAEYKPFEFANGRRLFDYQEWATRLAIGKRRFAVFADCGLGKTLMLLEFARHAHQQMRNRRKVLIISPLMVIGQTMEEAEAWYGGWLGHIGFERVTSAQLPEWTSKPGGGIGITNYEALNQHVPRGKVGAIIVDESSMLKSHYGKWGREIIRLGRGLEWKLALTGTPAPNDRIEYANHAVFCDAFPTVNSFLARYFINRGQTDNRWELKPHAIRPFYRDLSHWCIFLSNPATYGFRGHANDVPPMHVHIEQVPLTQEQRDLVYGRTGELFVNNLGGIQSRSAMATIAKGWNGKADVPTLKTQYIRDRVNSWPDESTIIWCIYNREQAIMERAFPEAGSIAGDTSQEDRERIIRDFKAGRTRVLISKAKVLGFGLNLQIATRQVFSGLQDSYESYYQCVKRSNRYGSTRPLNVHIPITDIERPMIETVLSKAKRVESDTAEQERIFNASR